MGPLRRFKIWRRERNRWKRCPHSNLLPIYGDAVIYATPNFNRLRCIHCGNFLRGPVDLAATRAASEYKYSREDF